jgi:hypothetical protein
MDTPGGVVDPSLGDRLSAAVKEKNLIRNMNNEIKKMKQGSIGLVNQITTISKIRIYDPKSSHDVLGNIRFSSEKLDIIDDAIKDLYLKKR